MRTHAAWILAAALCSGAAAQTWAQGTNTTDGARHHPAGPMAELTFEKMDANGDGKVTPEEFQAAHTDMAKKRFAAMDANGDGVLTKDEVEKARAAHHGRAEQAAADGAAAKPASGVTGGRPAGGPMAELTFEKMDANGDGKVTLEEFQAAFTTMLKARFAAMDTNGDGVLTKDEVEKARAAHRPQGQQGQQGQHGPHGPHGGGAAPADAPQK